MQVSLILVAAAVLFLFFVYISGVNAWFLWRGIRHNEHYSVVPIVGALCGSAALWLVRMSDSASHLPVSGWWLAAPFVLDIGTPILLISLPMLITREMRNHTE